MPSFTDSQSCALLRFFFRTSSRPPATLTERRLFSLPPNCRWRQLVCSLLRAPLSAYLPACDWPFRTAFSVLAGRRALLPCLAVGPRILPQPLPPHMHPATPCACVTLSPVLHSLPFHHTSPSSLAFAPLLESLACPTPLSRPMKPFPSPPCAVHMCLVMPPYPTLMNLSAGTVLISMRFLVPLCLFVRLAGYGCCTICSSVTSSAPMALCMCSSPNGPRC